MVSFGCVLSIDFIGLINKKTNFNLLFITFVKCNDVRHVLASNSRTMQ